MHKSTITITITSESANIVGGKQTNTEFPVITVDFLPILQRFSSSDGISREEEGQFPNPDPAHQGAFVKGSYSYTGDDGVVYTVHYTADDNGFHPEGDHIKVPPFVPWLHHHHEDEPQNPSSPPPQRDDIVPPSSPLYLPTTPTPIPRDQEPVDNGGLFRNDFVRTQPNPQLYLPDNLSRQQHVTTTLKPPRSTTASSRFVTTTQRPVRILSGRSTTLRPLDDFGPLGNSLLTLIPTVRGRNIQEINNLMR